jgi:hypothetical protein
MRRLLRVLCALVVGWSPPAHAAAPSVQDPALAAGIALAREGDFQGALLKLDEVVRRLESEEAPARDRAQGHLYLGISYLELGQEMPALERFRAAILRDPALRLDPAEFSPQVIRFFEAARQEVAAMSSPAAPATAPTPAPPAKLASPPAAGEKKGSAKTVLLVVGAGVAVAAAALALAGGDEEPPTTTPPAPAAPRAVAAWTSRLDLPGARAEILFDGAVLPAESAAGLAQRSAPGPHSLEGRLLRDAARPGHWRFDLPGIRKGSLRVSAGTVAWLAADAVVFRLAGKQGERVAVAFDLP